MINFKSHIDHRDYKGLSEKEYWEAIRLIYTSTEFGLLDVIGEVKMTMLFDNSKFRDSDMMMNENELHELENLPENVQIFRGISSDEQIDFDKHGHGFSWTLNRSIADFFANRQPFYYHCVLTAYVDSADIISLFNEKDEREVLVRPKDIAPFLIERWENE